jgi:hypothetical protein
MSNLIEDWLGFNTANATNSLGDTLSQISGINPNINDDTLGQSSYDFTSRVFPDDIGNEDQGHYMVININVPVRSGGVARTQLNGQGVNNPFAGSVLSSEYSKVDVLRFGGYSNFGGVPGEISLGRSTRRIKESIALHMPTGLNYTTFNDYADISLTSIGGTLLAAGGKLGAGLAAFIAGAIAAPLGAAVGGATAAVSSIGGEALNTASRLAGYPINPRVEVLFATTRQRQFMLEVMLVPKNQKEADSIEKIVRTLRYHSSPELDRQFGVNGLTFIPPAEFDITFFKDGDENKKIPRINTCVMERIDVDYAPFGGIYSTFRDGHPVGVRLSMGFREIEIPHKLRILQGF